MTTLRAFTCDDLFRFNNINLDPLTETVSFLRKKKSKTKDYLWRRKLEKQKKKMSFEKCFKE
ncbi:N-acetyltransferase 5 (ARD1 homolog, S. cerevisiae), isoform CRA_e [Mus musculus]|uniref:N(alpha)-acetyltransferase 20, NatB catalytic subunit n=1 Tax=Mus musculus TaxID=10090 RepID=G5E8X4_MOUSE|nr:N-acetyltransferase 5 (ARD1 homolog, S. cerevisiae), isoform CRA_e [Mus musculus]